MLEGRSSLSFIEFMTHFCLQILCFFTLVSMSVSCRETNFNNLCDPKSKDYQESLVIRFINFDETSHCGVVLEVLPPSYLICPALIPKPNGSFFTENFETNGNRLSFSANPALPIGISFSLFSNSIQGIYSGWKANRQTFTITASNPKGSASCTYNPAWMGKLPFKTKQTNCYDGNVPTPFIDPSCVIIPGQDGQTQKGIPQVFIGPSLVAGEEITTDQTTGLVWQRCSAGQTNLTTCTGGTDLVIDWFGAISYCQGLNLAGRTWRLPNVSELRSLLDYYLTNGYPGFDPIYFPNTATAVAPAV